MLRRPAKKEPGKTPLLVRSSLTQTRLNVIVEGSAAHCLSVNEWLGKIRHAPRVYTREALEARLLALAPRIDALEALVTRPPATMDPEAWLEERERLGRLKGQARAIRLILEQRSAYLSSASMPPPPTPKTDPGPPAPDPFENE